MTHPHATSQPRGVSLTHVTYGLFVLGLFTGLFTTIIGLILAYLDRDPSPGLANSHYTYLIDTFWSAIVWALILAAIVIVFGIITLGLGFMSVGLVYLGFMIWYGYRLIKGWVDLTNGRDAPIVS